MKFEDFEDHATKFLVEMQNILSTKNADYSNVEDDAMSNYYTIAEQVGITPIQAWMVLMMKHMTAIQTFSQGRELRSETIHSRFVDLANYMILGDALVKDIAQRKLVMTTIRAGNVQVSTAIQGKSYREEQEGIMEPQDVLLELNDIAENQAKLLPGHQTRRFKDYASIDDVIRELEDACRHSLARSVEQHLNGVVKEQHPTISASIHFKPFRQALERVLAASGVV